MTNDELNKLVEDFIFCSEKDKSIEKASFLVVVLHGRLIRFQEMMESMEKQLQYIKDIPGLCGSDFPSNKRWLECCMSSTEGAVITALESYQAFKRENGLD